MTAWMEDDTPRLQEDEVADKRATTAQGSFWMSGQMATPIPRSFQTLPANQWQRQHCGCKWFN